MKLHWNSHYAESRDACRTSSECRVLFHRWRLLTNPSTVVMSSEATAEPLRRDFRSSYYYKSLHGFKGGGGEKSLTHLEALIKMEVLGKRPASRLSLWKLGQVYILLPQILRSWRCSACSTHYQTTIAHSSGKCYWVGSLCICSSFSLLNHTNIIIHEHKSTGHISTTVIMHVYIASWHASTARDTAVFWSVLLSFILLVCLGAQSSCT